MSAQLDAMVAYLSEDNGDVGGAGEDMGVGEAADATSADPELRASNARAVVKGMLEGFTASMAPATEHHDANEEANDGRMTR